MDRPIHLKGRELVIDDGRSLVAVYPYRDADASKLTGETSRLLLLGCGVPGLAGRGLREATERAAELIKRYAGK
jgi:DNA/RNA-binding domain of Phe-tRNA-synthetase-like protein